MNKITLALLIFLSINIYAVDYTDGLVNVSIDNNQMIIIDNDLGINNEYQFKQRNIYSIEFLKVNKTLSFLSLHSDDLIVLYSPIKRNPYFIGTNMAFHHNIERIYTFEQSSLQGTSFLREGQVSYKVENLGNYDLDKPWATNRNNGIGEQIYIANSVLSNLYISIGYVSMDKPYLYKENARPKNIKVTDLTNNITQILELKDTPNPQKIILGKSMERKIVIEIMDIYPGTKYKDLCINFIIPEA